MTNDEAIIDLSVLAERMDSKNAEIPVYDISLEAVDMAIKALSQHGWIPVTFRPMTDEEKKDYAERTEYDEEDFDTILNCPLPEDGETVLITDRLGNVEVDTFIDDGDGCYFEYNCDMKDVKAWMPLPEPFEPQESEEV